MMIRTSERSSATSWRTVAYVAFVLVGALLLARFSFVLAALAAALMLAPLVMSTVRATRARLGDVRPEFVADARTSHAGMREFENLPFENPFDPSRASLPLDRRISMAAEAAAEHSRGVSVLYLHTPNVDCAQTHAILRDALRPSDHVEMIGGDEIVACLNLIRDLSNVDGVIARLTRRLHEKGWPEETPPRFGRALYPIHGYDGADLIAAARAQVRPAEQPKTQPPRRAALAETKPKARRRKVANGC